MQAPTGLEDLFQYKLLWKHNFFRTSRQMTAVRRDVNWIQNFRATDSSNRIQRERTFATISDPRNGASTSHLSRNSAKYSGTFANLARHGWEGTCVSSLGFRSRVRYGDTRDWRARPKPVDYLVTKLGKRNRHGTHHVFWPNLLQ